ncbi:hypothetical protein [Halobacterium yunchengense]|uniref:hypothetical protein n=1 Tax=Halobacterium yunchengense TaxID=3108497 RepID=UPI00300BA755
MGVGNELQELGRFLDDCERQTDAVECFDVAAVTDVGDRRLAADLELTVALSTGPADCIELSDPVVGADGTVRFALGAASDLPTDTDHDVAVEPTAAALNGDGTATVTLAATVPATAAQSPPDGDAEAGLPEDDHGAAASATDDQTAAASATDGPPVAGDGGTATRPVSADEDDGDGEGDEPTLGGDSVAVDDESEDERDDATQRRSSSVAGDASGPTKPSECEVPPFKDRALLADVYESCETFSEMADALPMDVTGETVRRYMIEHDIHEPTTYQTGSDGGQSADRSDDKAAGSDVGQPADGSDGQLSSSSEDARPSNSSEDARPVVLSDGIGLPDDVTVDTLVETVRTSNTIYEVRQDIDVDREDALEMLRELNLLDLVVGRLATEGEREITHDDVVDCLREASAVE